MDFKKILSYELNQSDIKAILGSANIITYPNLRKYKTFDECFKQYDYFILFFETTNKDTGHWQTLFKDPNRPNTIQFFDSYGLKPSGDKNYIEKSILIKLNEIKPYLPDLIDYFIKVQNGKFYYNTYQYQSWAGNVSTCGRWVSVRLLNKHLNDIQFYNFINNYKRSHNLNSLDEVVCMITYNIIGK